MEPYPSAGSADLDTADFDTADLAQVDLDEPFETDQAELDATAELDQAGVDEPVEFERAAPASAVGESDDDGEGDLDMAVLERIERELADVELALERLGDGSYGRCENCGELFSDELLESTPAGRYCRAHLPLDLG